MDTRQIRNVLNIRRTWVALQEVQSNKTNKNYSIGVLRSLRLENRILTSIGITLIRSGLRHKDSS